MKQSMRVLTSQETVEWYTPPWLINQIIRPLLGGVIDLDPCSPSPAPYWIKARNFYTPADDGLCLPWVGRVFVNPPYNDTGEWLRAAGTHIAVGQASALAFLCNAAPGYRWFEIAWRRWPVLFFRERVKFWYLCPKDNIYKEAKDAAKKSQAIIFMYHGGIVPTGVFQEFADRFGMVHDFPRRMIYG
jgi:hypothetical protein